MQEPKVSVAIMNEPSVKFELDGAYSCNLTEGVFSGKFEAKLDGTTIVVVDGDKEYKFNEDVIFSPADEETESYMLRDVTIGIKFHWQRKENQRFVGALKFLIENDKLAAVNVLPVESYLTSVISSEMSATSSVGFLKAHSIISRSWLLAQIQKNQEIQKEAQAYKSTMQTEEELIKWYDREDHTLYDVCADDHCQRYQGITKLAAHNSQVAVEETRGLVLKYNDKICDARFSKSCGGISESFENVWEPVEHKYLKDIVDYKFDPDGYDLDLTKEEAARKWILGNPPAFCNTTDQKILSQVLNDYDQETKDFYRWEVEYTQEKVAELINTKSGFDFGDIIDLIPVERGQSGRLIKLKIVGSKKTMTIGKELEIRKILSDSHLYSSAFVVEKGEEVNGVPQKFTLKGAGWGHGVGLCQIGAAVMSEKGYTFDEILLHYFRGAAIEKIYE